MYAFQTLGWKLIDAAAGRASSSSMAAAMSAGALAARAVAGAITSRHRVVGSGSRAWRPRRRVTSQLHMRGEKVVACMRFASWFLPRLRWPLPCGGKASLALPWAPRCAVEAQFQTWASYQRTHAAERAAETLSIPRSIANRPNPPLLMSHTAAKFSIACRLSLCLV